MPQPSNVASVFLAYRHTGESLETLGEMLEPLAEVLKKANVEFYCTYFKEDSFRVQNKTPAQIMEHAFEEVAKRDVLFVVKHSDKHSEGMLLEIGYAIKAKIPVVVAVHADIKDKTYVDDVADSSYEWRTIDELVAGLEKLVN